MSDPYLDLNEDNDLSNIQVNVFRIRERNISDDGKFIHDDVIIFNPENSDRVEISGIKLKNSKVIKEKIYLLETKIEELEIEKKKLHTIIRHFVFQNNVNNNFIKDLINLDDEELSI